MKAKILGLLLVTSVVCLVNTAGSTSRGNLGRSKTYGFRYAPSKIKLEAGQTLAFEGDSLTFLRSGPALDQWPWLRISNNHRTWPDVMSELLFAWHPEMNLTFRQCAAGGSTCRIVSNRFDTVVGKIKPDWIFMTLSGNDIREEISLEEFESVLRDYIGKVNKWDGKVVFVYGFAAYPNASAGTIKKAPLRIPYFEVQKKLAAELDNVYCINVNPGLKEKSELLYKQYTGHNIYSDGGHFSNLGAMIIAGEVLKACGLIN